MPILRNPRHERFAQELAKGKTQDEAYQIAGYKPDRPHASRLATKGNVVARVAELQGKGAERAKMTIESLIGEADEIQRAAFGDGQFAAAHGALKLKAIFGGLYVEKAESKVETTEHTIERAPTANDWQRAHSTEEKDSRLAPTGGSATRPH